MVMLLNTAKADDHTWSWFSGNLKLALEAGLYCVAITRPTSPYSFTT